ncbi:hypothetical protein [Pseudomonas sp. NFACC39-1]|uniref:hypothetical protein n=1 Tax=Pseudomonas sp. NFACC39-1 TaxID=1566195 RepID=UPI0008B5B444|nr:hypothetical protein [Pseudomonas sp. NFACC39-1]SEN66490.1 hypothetical protein SAMN03159293_00680 [Pseudomonas sp. NFACC39-1]
MNERPRSTAIHEAGHALAFWWNGLPIKRITVRTRDEAYAGPMIDLLGNPHYADGLVEADYLVLRPALAARGIAEYLPSMVDSIERDLLHCFAGPVAEAVYRHGRSDRMISTSGRGDLDRGHELICLLPPRMLLDAESRAIARCSCLVHRYWFAVCAVAGLLQEQGVVEGKVVTALLCEITGESPSLLGNGVRSLDS